MITLIATIPDVIKKSDWPVNVSFFEKNCIKSLKLQLIVTSQSTTLKTEMDFQALRVHMQATLEKLLKAKTSLIIPREKYDAIQHHLKNPSEQMDAHFKSWFKRNASSYRSSQPLTSRMPSWSLWQNERKNELVLPT